MNKILSTVALLAITGNVAMAGGNFSSSDGNLFSPIEPTMEIPEKEVVVVEDNVKYDGFYAGAALSYMRMNEVVEYRGHALTLVGGYYFNKYIGVEARYTTTLSDIDEDKGRVVVSVDRDLNNVGIYIKPMFNITTGFSAYGLAGYGKAESGDLEEKGAQWGIGTKYELANGVGFFFDYMSFYDDENFDTIEAQDVFFSSTNVGATYTF